MVNALLSIIAGLQVLTLVLMLYALRYLRQSEAQLNGELQQIEEQETLRRILRG